MILDGTAGDEMRALDRGRRQRVADEEDERGLGPVPYVVAALSTLPVIGLAFALVAISWGLATLPRGGRLVAIIGVVGIGTQAFLAAGVVYLMLFR